LRAYTHRPEASAPVQRKSRPVEDESCAKREAAGSRRQETAIERNVRFMVRFSEFA